MTATPLIAAEHLTKVFHRRGTRVTAVSDVSFELHEGESLAIVGESGSGKSTVARIAMGIIPPTGGRIQLAGGTVPATGRRTRDRRRRAGFVQMVFQDPYSSLDPRQRVGDCLGEAVATQADLPAADRRDRVRQLLDQVALDASLAEYFPHALSGGQRQRVAIARALAPRPRVLVLDEAVSALDVSVQARILELLERIRAEENVSFVFISHDLGVVRRISDSVLVMKRGEVVERGRTATVLDQPRHPYTRLLRACVPGPGWSAERALAAIDAYRGAS